MTENIRKLLELASSNEELKSKLSNADKDTLISLAKDNGIELTDADFGQNSQLSDDELDAVSGGRFHCNCVKSGNGTDDEDDPKSKSCSCSYQGVGYGTSRTSPRCWCDYFGNGNTR